MVIYQHHWEQHLQEEEEEEEEEESSLPSLLTPPRISFSALGLLDDEDDEEDFISINPKKPPSNNNNNDEFEFFSSGKDAGGQTDTMSTADELFYDGKLLPFWQKQPSGGINARGAREIEAEPGDEEGVVVVKAEENKAASGSAGHPSWYLDEDPSPRPPKCTVLWKELLRLRKQRGSSSLLPSSSSSSTSSTSSGSMADVAATEDDRKDAGTGNLREIYMQRIRKGLEKTRSGSMRIRPIASIPICKHARTNSNGGGLPPLFPIRKGRSV